MAMKSVSSQILPSTSVEMQLKPVQNESTTSHLSFCEYFAGIGLVRLGLERAGWKIQFANDFSLEKFNMYAGYFKDASKHYSVENIFDLESKQIPSTLLATASFPCTDLSLAGNLNGLHGKYSSAFWGFADLINNQKQKPKLILLENVMGWLSSNKGKDFSLTIETLNQLGYACDVYTINASYFVPQSRPRVFVVGITTSTPNQDIEKLLRRDSSVASKRLKEVVKKNHKLQWHMSDIPDLPDKTTIKLSDIVENFEENDVRWWPEDEVRRHLAMMSIKNRKYLEEIRALTHYTYKTMYRRTRNGEQRAEIRKDDIAGCLRTAGGGSSRQMLVRVGQDKILMRLMTPREYARLQGAPDDYPVPEAINKALTGFGDAVCVPVITWLADYVLNPLALNFMDLQADRLES